MARFQIPTLSPGLRWDLDPAPQGADHQDAYTLFGSLISPAYLSLAPRGTPLWQTSWFNFAPRLGAAWAADDRRGHQLVVRAGVVRSSIPITERQQARSARWDSRQRSILRRSRCPRLRPSLIFQQPLLRPILTRLSMPFLSICNCPIPSSGISQWKKRSVETRQ